MHSAQAPDIYAMAQWLRARGVVRLVADSRQAQANDGFVAWPGFVNDGRHYVPQALAAGAVAAVVEAEGAEAFGFKPEQVLPVPGLKAWAGALASAFEGEPSAALDVVAVTGTNGKTSTAWWTAQALMASGRPCGLVGTLGVGQPGALQSTGLTTPDPVSFQTALRRFANAGLTACAIEASSIGLVEHRLAGTRIAVAQFTNFTQDHLDFHGNMDAYWRAKAMLFDWPGLKVVVLNVDDPKGVELARALTHRPGLEVFTYGVRGAAAPGAPEPRLTATGVRHHRGGLAFDLIEGSVVASVHTRLAGDFNVANLLAVVGALRGLGADLHDAAACLAGLTPVPGRMQVVALEEALAQPLVVVDYAHTPDALEKALIALRSMAASRGGALRVVFGCGGDRDATKRPLMGAAAARLADEVWVTSDNPRNEDPRTILTQVLAGISASAAPQVQADRALAIEQAVAACHVNDVLLIAGKGHEAYQEIQGQRKPFSDELQAMAALRRRDDRQGEAA